MSSFSSNSFLSISFRHKFETLTRRLTQVPRCIAFRHSHIVRLKPRQSPISPSRAWDDTTSPRASLASLAPLTPLPSAAVLTSLASFRRIRSLSFPCSVPRFFSLRPISSSSTPLASKMANNIPASNPFAFSSSSGLLFRQLFESLSCTYTYILADTTQETCPGLVIDPAEDTSDRDVSLIKELGVTPLYALNTHVHADHITGTAKLKGAFPGLKTVISEASGAKADVHVRHRDLIHFGSFSLEVRSTPGHTAGCVVYVLRKRHPLSADVDSPTRGIPTAIVLPVDDNNDDVSSIPGMSPPLMAFTGDALLIRGCGRTDFQGGDARQLYRSVHSQVLSLPAETFLFPAHDYKGRTVTTVGEERAFNPRLTKSEDDFKDIMDKLGLPYPKQIDKAMPANMVCGYHELL